MRGFPGFPPGKTRLVALPEAVFNELLPLIDDLAELKVTLYCYWRLSQGQGTARFVRRRDLLDDEGLLSGLKSDAADDPVSVLEAALERAVARGTLLHVHVARDDATEDWYFANTSKGRAAVRQIEQGDWPDEVPTVAQAKATRPNIFVLYEQNIGLLQPLIADELRQAEQDYPGDWIEEAFRLAAEANVRRWSYVRAILERWSTEGKSDGTSWRDSGTDYRRYIEGKYADYIEH
jgi:DnaD/phage-associated family protein